MSLKLIKQGAEARVYTMPFEPLSALVIVKERFKKTYRQPSLDERLTKSRLIQESRALVRLAKEGVDTPTLFLVDLKRGLLYMEYISGPSLRDFIGEGGLIPSLEKSTADQIGQAMAQMHKLDIIHGDLTTSNMLLRPIPITSRKEEEPSFSIVLIDFGLSYQSSLEEDKAVDLYVLDRALSSTHPQTRPFFEFILLAYRESFHKSASILKKLTQVQSRGRKKLILF